MLAFPKDAPSEAVAKHALWSEIYRDNPVVSFQLQGDTELVCQRLLVTRHAVSTAGGYASGICLVTGEQIFEHDRSAARGAMVTRGLYVFRHDSELGNAHAHALFDRLAVQRNLAVEVARGFDAYSVTFDGQPVAIGASLQATPGVTMIRRC